MRILITGGLGYVGGRVANYLKQKAPNADIFLTTRKDDGNFPQWTKIFTVLQMDLLNQKSIDRCLNESRPGLIIHFAALNEIDSAKNPELALEINVGGIYKLLDAAHKKAVERFIYFSTFHVYGDTPDSIITEQTPTRPFHPYAITHRAAEDFVRFFQHYYGIKSLIFRLSNAYGYPMDREVNRWTLVFNDLCKQAVTTGKIILKSSGKQHRDFIALNDVARAVHHFVFVRPELWADGLYNLGGERSLSIQEAVKLVSQVYKKQYDKQIKEIKADDKDTARTLSPVRYSIEKLKATGFKLKGDMAYEIKKTLSLCEEF